METLRNHSLEPEHPNNKDQSSVVGNRSRKDSNSEILEHVHHRPWYKDGNSLKILFMCILTLGFAIAEVLTGIFTNSLALLSDAMHMFSDLISLIIGFIAIQMSKRSHNAMFSYGWVRSEVIGALINSTFLIAVCFFILLESIQRFLEKPEIVDPKMIVIVAGAGLGVNLIGLIVLSSGMPGHSHSHGGHSHGSADSGHSHESKLNMQGVFLHVLGDALGSIGALVSGLCIWLVKWEHINYIDPVCSILIALIILKTSFPLLKKTLKVLMQSVPENIDLSLIQRELQTVEGVVNVHELHVWQLADTKVIGTAHISCHSNVDFVKVAQVIKNIFHSHGVHATTVQPEFIQELTEDICTLPCSPTCEATSSQCCDPQTSAKSIEPIKRRTKSSAIIELP